MTKRKSASAQLREDKKRAYKLASNPVIKRRKKEDRLRKAKETINIFHKPKTPLSHRELDKANKAYEEILIEKLGGGNEGKKELNRRMKELKEKRERGNLN